jgi:sigma-B regulation protein RsbU (phosphoserine phosphatase)
MYKNKNEIVALHKNMKLSRSNYKEIWNKVNELIFVIEIDENFIPKRFIDSNNKMRSALGYSKDELLKTPPADILSFNTNEIIQYQYRKLMYKKRDKVEIILEAKNKKHIYVKANIILFSNDNKNYILTIATDITKNEKMKKQIDGILNGLPDVIKVFNPDHTIVFFNEAGYNFYKKTQ